MVRLRSDTSASKIRGLVAVGWNRSEGIGTPPLRTTASLRQKVTQGTFVKLSGAFLSVERSDCLSVERSDCLTHPTADTHSELESIGPSSSVCPR